MDLVLGWVNLAGVGYLFDGYVTAIFISNFNVWPLEQSLTRQLYIEKLKVRKVRKEKRKLK